MSDFFRCALLGLALLISTVSAQAGSIHFGLSRNGNQLTVINHGDSSAYYPVVLRFGASGRWEALPPVPPARPPADMPAGTALLLQWPDPAPGEQLRDDPFGTMLPVMVRFFDQAGSAFGQISFFNQPPPAVEPLAVDYRGGWVSVAPPAPAAGLRTTWLIWPQEEGIRPLARPVDFTHRQPAVRRIDWQPAVGPLRVHLGDAQPSAMLLHDTPRGYELQIVASGDTQERRQRAAWLRGGRWFYAAAAAALAATFVLLMVWRLARRGVAR